MIWRPLSVRHEPQAVEEHDALHDDVPPWLRAGAAGWVDGQLRNDERALLLLEQSLRFPLNWRSGTKSALATVVSEVSGDGERALDVIDYVLMTAVIWPRFYDIRKDLESMLAVAGSAWMVGQDPEGRWCLLRRVDESVEHAAREEMEQAGNAARHLSIAWHRVYGRQPDASGGYREAVRAVEAAVKPVISPNDRLATLGKMIKAVQDKPSKWVSDLGSLEVVARMMGELWTAQLDRHGTDDESVPLTVSSSQAEAAVHLAVTLVHWFRNGHVRIA